jgi:muramoyltetrapeptide carboxypeptidase
MHVQRSLPATLTAALILTLLAAACQSTRPPAPCIELPADGLPMVQPPRLEPGDTIMFVAPAGDLNREKMMRAKERLEAMGYTVKMRRDLFASEGYLAGSDERRADELMQAFLDPEVDAVFPGTGGYGTMRIFDRLDFEKIRAHPKILLGFSDITGLHLALNRRAGLVTFHTPTPMWGLGGENGMTPFSDTYFWKAILADETVKQEGYTIEIPPEAPQPIVLGTGRARGRLTGGNLSLVAALEGTPYAVDTRDAILMIEDVHEAPYRIDRMLCQLKLAGKLDTLRGAVLGQFTRTRDRDDDPEPTDPRFTVDGVLRQYFEPLGIPVLMNYPVGHHKMNAGLPMGGMVEIDADEGLLRILPYQPADEGP